MCYKHITDQQTFLSWIKTLEKSSLFAFHMETNFQNSRQVLIGLSIAINIGSSVYLSLLPNDIETFLELTLPQVLSYLKPILENNKIKKIGENLKSYYRILKFYDIELLGIYFDTQVGSYVINPLSIKKDFQTFIQDWFPNCEKILVNKESYFPQYLAQKADIILKLYFKMCEYLNSHLTLKNIFDKIEMPLLIVLSRIECNGVIIDAALLKSYSDELASRIRSLENMAYKIAGEDFNLASSKQLQKVLFKQNKNIIQPTLTKRTCGFMSANEKVLVNLTRYHQLAKIIIEYRSLAKLKNSYTDKLPQLINVITRRVHSFYDQTLTTTSRLSSRSPNLQNIPIRNAQGRRIRQAFIASKQYKIVSADYSQIELRVLAHLSKDKKLLNCFHTNQDLHAFTAAKIFGIEVSQVTQIQRRKAKIINFGVIYGMSAFGLSNQLNISIKAAKNYIDKYFEQYQGIFTYINKMKEIAKQSRYVTTLTGRRLYIPQIHSPNRIHQNAALRTAINAVIQGTAADIIKLAMISLDNWININHYTNYIKMIIQVHDELVFEVESSLLEIAIKSIRYFMENSMILEIPLYVNIGIGNNWEQAH